MDFKSSTKRIEFLTHILFEKIVFNISCFFGKNYYCFFDDEMI